jgi:hypothetical protein
MDDREWSETNARFDREQVVRRAEMITLFDQLQRQLDDLRHDILTMGSEAHQTPVRGS